MKESRETRDKIGMLYELYEQPMFRIAFRILDDEYAAEDAVHDAFVKLIANRDRIGDVTSTKTQAYAKAAVKSAAIDIYRKRRRETEHTAVVEEERFSWTHDTDARYVIDLLPEKYAKVVRYRFIEGLSTAETAAVLSGTESCVKKRVERARKLLAENIENEWRKENG